MTNDQHYRLAAAALFDECRRRKFYFPAHLFSDPCWEILLFLFANLGRTERCTIASMVVAIQRRPFDLAGWLNDLRSDDLVCTTEDPSLDLTAQQWSLSDKGIAAMRGFLSDRSQPD